jgi:hypothetical protein
VKLQQINTLVDTVVEFQSPHQRVDSADTAITDRADPFGHLVDDLAALEHRLRLVGVLFALEALVEISLVTAEDSAVSFVHLERAPFGCDRKLDNSYHNLN